MCGIVGAATQRNVYKILIEGLRRLEYRGYDSAGLSIIDKRAKAANAEKYWQGCRAGQCSRGKPSQRFNRDLPHPLGDSRRAKHD